MTSEMFAVVQRACEAWGTGDLGTLYELYTPDVTADGGKLWLETDRVIEGVDAVVNGFAELIGAFERNELFLAEMEVVRIRGLARRDLPDAGSEPRGARLLADPRSQGAEARMVARFVELGIEDVRHGR